MVKTKKYGFTLIELIIAIAVLGIIIVAFLNLFTFGIVGIFRAGDKGVAYMNAQEEIDTRLARGESIATDDLILNFDNMQIIVEGGLVETEQFVNKSRSYMEVFVPLVPTIQVIPNVNDEGLGTPITLDIIGKYTNFSDLSTAQILDKFGNVVATPTIDVTDTTHAELEFSEDLVNAFSDYAVRIISPVSGKPDEVVRAKYSIYPPMLMAVSDGEVYVSADGESWLNRSDISPFPSHAEFHTVAFENGAFVTGDSSGGILVHRDFLGWEAKALYGETDINGLDWSTTDEKYFVVGASGMIRTTQNFEGYNSVYTRATAGSLNDIAITSTGKVMAVGSGGLIAYASDGNTFVEQVIASDVDFNKVLAVQDLTNTFYITVGDGGSIYRSTDAVNWVNIPVYTTSNLNGIRYRPLDLEYPSVPGAIVVVGDGGVILVSNDFGVTWTLTTYEDGSVDLYDIAFLTASSKVFIAGEEVILKSINLSFWEPAQTFSGENLKSIVGR